MVRVFSVVKAIVNFCIKELGLDCKNALLGIYLPSEKNKKRHPIKDIKLKKLQKECVLLDDDIRWLVALISDTGMRLSEAVGLLADDIVLDEAQPHINLTKHPHRRLKTDASERIIPLVGSSLWAAKRVKVNAADKFCFSRYCSDDIWIAPPYSLLLADLSAVITRVRKLYELGSCPWP